MGKLIDLTGQRFGRWLVISKATSKARRSNGTYSMWLCRCSCGAERAVQGRSLRRGISTSCGCNQRESVTKHGGSPSKPSRTHVSWMSMIRRCTYPGDRCWDLYGGRGIKVCQRWADSFEAFLSDMGERPEGMTLDRIDVDGNYEPGNCRWATRTEQSRNQRTTRLVPFNGQELPLAQVAEITGISATTIGYRIDRGWPQRFWFEPPTRKRQRATCPSDRS